MPPLLSTSQALDNLTNRRSDYDAALADVDALKTGRPRRGAAAAAAGDDGDPRNVATTGLGCGACGGEHEMKIHL